MVSVTEEDLPTVETPNTLNVSPLGSFAAESLSENNSAKPEENKPAAAPSPNMPITKVQPFIAGKTPDLTLNKGRDVALQGQLSYNLYVLDVLAFSWRFLRFVHLPVKNHPNMD